MKKFLVVNLILMLVFSLSVGSVSISFSQKKYNESPMLTELVKAGKLPPVEERLPKNPFVVGPGVLISRKDLPDWKVGKYGGTIRSAHSVADWAPDVFIMNNEPLLWSTGFSGGKIIGNIIESFDVKDNKIFTFRLREGLKWSDGEPVTTEDVRFTYEDCLLNEKLTPRFPAEFRVGGKSDGEPMKLEVLDKYTFRITFPKPYAGFLKMLTIEGWNNYRDLIKPAHYLKQFHAKYTPIEKLKPLLEKEGLKNEWWQLFNLKDFSKYEETQAASIGFPVLTPWRLVKASGGVYEWERNPYYFKVDIVGNQLPYIDKIVSTQVQDVEMVNMKVLTGEVDFLRESTDLAKLPVYKQNEEKSGFRVILLDQHVTSGDLAFNLTYKDSVWRKIVGDVRFRKAVSLAINRKEVINSVYYGFASLPETVPSEYNVVEANKLLDQIGLSKRDPEGFRLRPDGKPFTVLIECGAQGADFMPVCELLVEYLKAIGIKATLKRIDPQLWLQRVMANEIQATVYWFHTLVWNNPFTSGIFWISAPEWNRWYTTNGKEGEEPPAWVKKGWNLTEEGWQVIPGSDEDKKLWRESLVWHKQYLPVVTITEKIKVPMIVSTRIKNVPRSGFAIGANYSVVQFFYEK
ncbi:MAG: ABC transporter substrate-binding protein [bacterium]